jgi:hypothetical protein
MPVASSAALGFRISRPTPSAPPTAAAMETDMIGVPTKKRARNTTTSGWIAPTVAATPPGRL